MNKSNKDYTGLGIFKTTRQRFKETMKGSDNQDSFLNKLLDLYEEMQGSNTLEKIELKYKKKSLDILKKTEQKNKKNAK